jgi:hypothetical protein
MAESVSQVVEKTTVFCITSFLPVSYLQITSAILIVPKAVMKAFSYLPAGSKNMQES